MAAPALSPDTAWRISADAGPFRSESFGVERLESHARDLAVALATVDGAEDPTFFKRFAANAAALRQANAIMSQASQSEGGIGQDAEWLIDNFYIVEEQLREIRDDLPRPFYRELPKTAAGEARVQAL